MTLATECHCRGFRLPFDGILELLLRVHVEVIVLALHGSDTGILKEEHLDALISFKLILEAKL